MTDGEPASAVAGLPWHDATISRVLALRDEGRLPNALAVTCAPGWGHGELATRLALALLEVDTISGPITEFAHPDFRWIAPEGAVIKVEQVRRINDLAVQTSQIAPRKVVVVNDAHLLNANAANALLKTLEEPPPNTHLLLATAHWGKLLPTVRSRCQRFAVAADQGLAGSWLSAQGIALSAEQYAQIGRAPMAASIEELSAYAGRDPLTSWLGGLSHHDLKGAVDAVLAEDVVAWLARWYRKLIGQISQSLDDPENDQRRAASLLAFADELVSARRQIETSNAANARILVEALVVRWLRLPAA